MAAEIKRATARRSQIHGTGLFATEDIPAGEKIIEYTGERITKTEAVRRYEQQAAEGAIYLFDLNSRHDIDGSVHGNEAKYANHSCEPNAETVIEKGRIWIEAMEDIPKGGEILYDYNFPLFDHEKRPCLCGTEKCRGWIINKDSYYYLRRKERLAAEQAGRNGAVARKGTKKSAKKGAKKAAKKSAKKGAKTAVKKPAKKGAKKAARKSPKRKTTKGSR